MKLLLDMGCSPRMAPVLIQNRFDTVHVREALRPTASDETILQAARDQGRIIVTFDLDFARLLAMSRSSGPSVILFRLNQFTTEQANLLLLNVLNRYRQSLEQGAIVVIDPDRFRVRLLPIQPK